MLGAGVRYTTNPSRRCPRRGCREGSVVGFVQNTRLATRAFQAWLRPARLPAGSAGELLWEAGAGYSACKMGWIYIYISNGGSLGGCKVLITIWGNWTPESGSG